MKKFLSLVLALIMTMSLVTVSAGAKDFTDDESLTYEEAVAVMSEIGVIDGYPDGSFKPQGGLTRGAAAKIICNMVLGPTTASALHADTAPFKDVPTDNIYAGYIAFCAKEGYISGYTDGSFRPAASLTSFAFMKMLLGALGYDAEIEGYTGNNCFINVAKQAIGIGLNGGMREEFNGGKNISREEAALFAFNTLKATLVDYDTKTSVNVGDATVVIAGSTAKPVAWSNSNVQTGINNDGNIDDDGFVQFAEQYFSKLSLDLDLDVFGRPARTWEYKGNDIGTFVAWDLQVGEDYKAKVTGKDLYDLLGRSIVEDKDYDVFVFIDGEDDVKVNSEIFARTDMNKNNKDSVGKTGDGVLTQVFVNPDSKEAFVCVINTYLAKASADYSEKKDEVSFDVWALNGKQGGDLVKGKDGKAVNISVSGEDFEIEDIEKDDFYLVQVAEGEIQTLVKADMVADTEISSFKLTSNVTAGGEKYPYASTAEYDVEVLDKYTSTAGTNLKNVTYNIYLDTYGNLIGVDLVSVPDNYVFITGMDSSFSHLANKTLDANAIFLDGTMEVIKVKADKGDLPTGDDALINSWCTYTVDKNGVYTLDEVEPAISKANNVKVAQKADKTYDTVIDKKHVSLPGSGNVGSDYNKVYGNDNTVYLTASIKEIKDNAEDYPTAIIIDGVDSVTTGIKNANIQPWTHKNGENSACEIHKADTAITSDSAVTNNRYSAGVYTLYKENGYIIAAIVVGEDAAASKNLVYVNSSNVELESYDKTEDEWTWTRKVICAGEEIEIKEVGDNLSLIGNLKNGEGKMAQHGWYEVKYNAEGEVISVEAASDALGAKYVNDCELVPGAVQAYDTVLYSQGILNDKPVMKASTLYAKTSADSGFFVAEDAKIVLFQYNKNKLETTYEVGAEALEDIIDTLNENHDGEVYNYTISAILESGAATTVIIKDDSNPYDAPAAPDLSDDINVESVNLYAGTFTYSVDSGKVVAPTTDDIFAILSGAKCTGITYDSTSDKWSYTMPNGVTVKDHVVTGTQVCDTPAGMSCVKVATESSDGGVTSATVVTVELTDEKTTAAALKSFTSDVDKVVFYVAGVEYPVADGSTTTIKDILAADGFAGFFALLDSDGNLIEYVKFA